MKIIKGTELNDEQRYQVSKIFSEGFYQWFKYFSKNIDKLAKAFNDCFIWDKFYCYIEDERVCGMAAISDCKSPTINLSKKQMKKSLGLIKGLFAYIILKKALQNHEYPFEISEDTGSIEYVAVEKESRNKGIATALMHHIIADTDYTRYILEVADTNTHAVSLYSTMGFKVFHSVPEKHPKQSGINNLLYMEFYTETSADNFKD